MSKPKIIKAGTVRKIIQPVDPKEVEKAEIEVLGADPLYREIRIENLLHDENGRALKLKEKAKVAIIIEAETHQTSA